MDKFNFVRDGESKLPPGFRFQPTDEEIVFQYLARKIFSCPLPASVIPEINVFSFDPWELPGNSEQDRYFFANRELNHHRNIVDRRGSCVGLWKVTGSEKRIICSRRMPIVGIKKTLVFYKGKHPRATRTDWFMHVYCLFISGNAASSIQQKKHFQGSLIQIGKWILCHVFLKRKSIKAGVYDSVMQQNSERFTTAEITDTDSSSATSSCDSDSSVLSEVSSSTANSENNIRND